MKGVFHRAERAFSLVEALVAVSCLAIAGATAFAVIGDSRERSALQKLELDVRSINSAVSVYRVFGGSLASATAPAEVLRKLQSHADATTATQTAGLTGSFIDPRLAAEMQTPEEAASGAPRARWNPASQQFELSYRGAPGVKRFTLEEALTATAPELEDRDPGLKLAMRDEWIWDYTDPAAVTPIPVTGVPLATPSPIPPSFPPPASSPQALQPPEFSIASGTFPITDFDLALDFTNPNPSGTSRVLVSVDSAGWKSYTGSPILVLPGSSVRAYAESIDSSWLDSDKRSHTYHPSPVQLNPPLIISSSPHFDYGANQFVTINLAETNDPEVSELVYYVPGAGWQSYNGAFQLDAARHRGGVKVMAMAKPRKAHYKPSSKASLQIGDVQPIKLVPPTIHIIDGESGPPDVSTLWIDNPNPIGSSEIDFIVVPVPSALGCDLIQGKTAPEGFLTYLEPFTVPVEMVPTNFAVLAYARSTNPAYLDSGFGLEYHSTSAPGLRGGHFDVDTSSFLAPIGNGSTDGHVHAYDNKYDTNIVDFFALADQKLHNITEDIGDPNVKFKLIVVNANLTPDARLTINAAPGSSGVPGTTYDNTPIEDLPVYSLGGVDGTTKLENFSLTFDAGAIANAGLIPTNTGDVKKNTPGKHGEWRNGAFTIQAVRVNDDGTDAFDTDPSRSAGDHGVARNGLLWESTVFWHWKGASYHNPQNNFVPHDPATVSDGLEGGDEEPLCDH